MNPLPSLTHKADQLAALLRGGVFTHMDGQVMGEEDGLGRGLGLLNGSRQERNRLYLVGNGGSNAVIAHVANDFLKTCHCLVHILHDPATLTCLANDYGYENAYATALSILARPGDLLIAVSSSGRSANILNAVQAMTQAGGQVMTFSGFAPDNPLRQLGQWNYWIPSSHYGLVEIAHLVVLHHLAECLANQDTL
ncbi:MAG: SIS domain-containing protein [Magnetococcales bacterium]|nr:SIS domain-containing protein [Magnetococcales bacterium]NGZ26286.1 SIS domain-containing protein [Magnetococcales bacterium]